MNNVKETRKHGNMTIIILFAILLILTVYTLFNIQYGIAKPTESQSIAQNMVIKMGTVELLVTDQNDEEIKPMENYDIDTGYAYASDDYKIRIKNVGTLPLQFDVVPYVTKGSVISSMLLGSKVTLWGTITDDNNAEDLSVGKGVLSGNPVLAKCTYLEPGDYRDIDISATIRKNVLLEFLDYEYDFFISACQVEPRNF